MKLFESINEEHNSEITINNSMNKQVSSCHILSNECVWRQFDGHFDIQFPIKTSLHVLNENTEAKKDYLMCPKLVTKRAGI